MSSADLPGPSQVHIAADGAGSGGGGATWSECGAVLGNGVFSTFPQPLSFTSRSAVQSNFHNSMVRCTCCWGMCEEWRGRCAALPAVLPGALACTRAADAA